MTKQPDAPVSQWILLRGLAREARHWGTFSSQLEGAIPNSRVVAIDLPGAGRYSEMRCPFSIRGITEFVREKFLELRERDERAGLKRAAESHLVAVSLGGMVAADWMERHPGDIATCTLMNTSFRGYSPIYCRLAPTSYLHMANIIKSRATYERELHVLRMVSNRPETYERIAKEWTAIYESRPVGFENFMRQLLAASRFEPKGPPPSIPILVLNSTRDRMVDPTCSEAITSRWNTEIRRHATAGHDLPLDEPEWVVEQIRDFWEEKHGRSARGGTRSSGNNDTRRSRGATRD